MKLPMRGLFASLAALLLALCVYSAGAQERKINIAYAGPSLIALPLLAAQEWKLFSQNGLSTQLIVMTFTISIPALSADQVDYLGGVGPATVASTIRHPGAGGLVFFRQSPLVLDGPASDQNRE